ncbi:MAG: hypothetical protein IPO55_01575 [Alphaproteobacteria bacterium]|nr:hypothetical protein [Alphaproteobacteria bacterium]
MTTALVKAEIARFLQSPLPEVLCIKGHWGVGKTFAWRQFLTEAAAKGSLGLSHYAYVSLFGLSSLDALRKAIVENSVSSGQIADGPSLKTYENIVLATGAFAGKLERFFGILGKADAGDALIRALFLTVKQRIICIDDLERAGSGLELRDALGLVSMLKEERQCKVVLLLNDQQMLDKNKADFDRLLEKVVDISLVFEPTSEEAVDIAFQQKSATSGFLRPKIIQLGITNIRIIKKIERLANRLHDILIGQRTEIIEQAMTTITLGSWSVLAPDDAPPSSYVKRYNRDMEAMRAQREKPEEQQKQWSQIIESFGYRYSDDLDLAIIDGAERGYFDEEAVKAAANEIAVALTNNKTDNAFTRAWDMYHGSLTADDDEVLDSLFKSALECLHLISPLNLNGTVMMLRNNGRTEMANQLVEAYMKARTFGRNALNEELRGWGQKLVDPKLESAFQSLESEFKDQRDPLEVMKKMTDQNGWSPEDIDLLAKQSPEQFEQMFEALQGRDLPRVAKFLVGLGGHEGENYRAMGLAIEGGLKRIAAKSPLKAQRVASYGIDLSAMGDVATSSPNDKVPKSRQVG